MSLEIFSKNKKSSELSNSSEFVSLEIFSKMKNKGVSEPVEATPKVSLEKQNSGTFKLSDSSEKRVPMEELNKKYIEEKERADNLESLYNKLTSGTVVPILFSKITRTRRIKEKIC